MRPRKILCPIDFSPCTQAVLEHASKLAEANEAELILVHVASPPTNFVSGYPGLDSLPPHRPEPDARLESTKLPRVVAQVDRVHLVGVEGESIVEYADEIGCDIIVMGTHGYGGIAKFFLGSVADYVLRHANARVIVVRDKKLESSNAAASGSTESAPASTNATG